MVMPIQNHIAWWILNQRITKASIISWCANSEKRQTHEHISTVGWWSLPNRKVRQPMTAISARWCSDLLQSGLSNSPSWKTMLRFVGPTFFTCFQDEQSLHLKSKIRFHVRCFCLCSMFFCLLHTRCVLSSSIVAIRLPCSTLFWAYTQKDKDHCN